MDTQQTNQSEQLPPSLEEFYQAWQDVESAILQLQEAAGKAREYLTEIAPELAQDPKSRQELDRFLYLERLVSEAGRLADDVRHWTDMPPRNEKQRKMSRKRTTD